MKFFNTPKILFQVYFLSQKASDFLFEFPVETRQQNSTNSKNFAVNRDDIFQVI